jgi:hypothetical protein
MSRAAMQMALDALEYARKSLIDPGSVGHLYNGDCPDEFDQNRSDQECPACKVFLAIPDAIAALRAALAASDKPADVQRDADRYRWLRNEGLYVLSYKDHGAGPEFNTCADLDAEIDAFMTATKETP